MENNSNNNVTSSEFKSFFFSTTGRLLFIGIISLLLFLPISQVNFLIKERKERSEAVRNELIQQWGGTVVLKGLVIRVPVIQKKESSPKYAFFFPESSSINLNTNVGTKKRGIFSTTIFQNQSSENAQFTIKSKVENLDWSKVQLGIITNASAQISSFQNIEMNGKSYTVNAQERAYENTDLQFFCTQQVAFPDASFNTKISLNASFVSNGSETICIQSLAKKSQIHMKSNWKSASFSGKHLPKDYTITKNGMKANWEKLNLSIVPENYHVNDLYPTIGNTSDINFKQGIDQYQLNERTIKYALLVIILTFSVFILIELVGKIVIHPLHYLFIGFGLILFYSLLLSFSEQLGFNRSYIIASSAIILLVTWYAKSILNSMKFALTSALSMGLLYVFLLVIVNLETYALIVGSIGLFIVLAAIMSFTRRLKVD